MMPHSFAHIAHTLNARPVHTPHTKRTHPFRGVRVCGWGCVCGLNVCGVLAEARAKLRGNG